MKAFLLAAAMAALLAVPAVSRAESGQPVLLVYRLESERECLTDILSACGYPTKAIPQADYHKDSLAGCWALVTTIEQPKRDALAAGIPVLCVGPYAGPVDGVQVQSARGLSGILRVGQFQASVSFRDQVALIVGFEGDRVGEMDFSLRGSFPYGVIRHSAAYAPNFSKDNIQPLALAFLMKQLLGDPEPGRLFLLINEVYPFSDLGMLCYMADELYRMGYPFTVSAMPVYDNLQYPAFLRYTQVLRYIQSRGGAVVMHDPIILAAEMESESIDTRLARARTALEQQGIILANGLVSPYPLSLDEFIHLSGTSTVFGPLPMDTAVILPIAKTPEAFDSMLQVIAGKWAEVTSLYRMATDEPYLYNEEPVDVQFAYREEVETSFEAFFSAGNRTLIVIVVISLVIFSGLLTGGYFLYQRKFLR